MDMAVKKLREWVNIEIEKAEQQVIAEEISGNIVKEYFSRGESCALRCLIAQMNESGM